MDQRSLQLIPENSSFDDAKTVLLTQSVTIGRQTDTEGVIQTAESIKFNSKVVSRQHAKLFYQSGRFYLQDTKSSSGTYLNGKRLSDAGQESEVFELKDGDLIKLGEDYNLKGVCHQAVVMRVRLPSKRDASIQESFSPIETEADDQFDASLNVEIRRGVDDEFNSIWNSLIADINNPLKRLMSSKMITSLSSGVNVLASPSSGSLRGGSISGTSGTSIASNLQPGSAQSTTVPTAKNDTTVTLIRPPNQTTASFQQMATVVEQTEHFGELFDSQCTIRPGQRPDVQDSVHECVAFILSLPWESPVIKDTLIEMVGRKDQQLLGFYKSLKGFPSSFINVATRYAKEYRSKIDHA